MHLVLLTSFISVSYERYLAFLNINSNQFELADYVNIKNSDLY